MRAIGLVIFCLIGFILVFGVPLTLYNRIHAKGTPELTERVPEHLDAVSINYKDRDEAPLPAFYIAMGSRFVGGLGLIVIGLGMIGYRRKMMAIGSLLFGQFFLLSAYAFFVS